jgi:hypothetical protein
MSDYHSSQRYRSSAVFDDENTEEMAVFDENMARRTNSKSSTDPYEVFQAKNVLVDLNTLSKGVTNVYKKFDKSKLSFLREKLSSLRLNQDGLYDRYLNLSALFSPKDFSFDEFIWIKDILVLVKCLLLV